MSIFKKFREMAKEMPFLFILNAEKNMASEAFRRRLGTADNLHRFSTHISLRQMPISESNIPF
jgi:hypothetical protein